jgi:hypothetical protein
VTALHALGAASAQVLLNDHLIEIGWKQSVRGTSLEKVLSELREAIDPDDPHRHTRAGSGHGSRFVGSITPTLWVVDIAALMGPRPDTG